MKAVVFDMDGVLFDTERLCSEGWNRVAKEQGLKDVPSVVARCIGLNENDTRALIQKHLGQDFPYDFFKKMVSEWFWNEIKEHGLPVKPGVKNLLDFLRQQEYKIGLASSSRRESVMKHLKQAEIEDYFSVIITGDMIEHSKPQPDIYLLACEKLGVEPGDAYAIEDAPNGIRSAYAAGMKPIMVPALIQPDGEMESLSFLICKDLPTVQEFLA